MRRIDRLLAASFFTVAASAAALAQPASPPHQQHQPESAPAGETAAACDCCRMMQQMMQMMQQMHGGHQHNAEAGGAMEQAQTRPHDRATQPNMPPPNQVREHQRHQPQRPN